MIRNFSYDDRISLIQSAKAALREAGTLCVMFTLRGEEFHYGPMPFEQSGFPAGTFVISESCSVKIGDLMIATQHPFAV